MADDYNARLSRYLDELDMLKEMSAAYIIDPNNNRPIVWRVNQKLDQIFVHISEKVNQANPENVKKQNGYEFKLRQIENKGLIIYKKKQDSSGEIIACPKKSIFYINYEMLVRQREIELRAILESLDLTNKAKPQAKRF